jgi:NAD(P)-dependent dehydrogenase (short-subunit alcohol dehydrogenase family)
MVSRFWMGKSCFITGAASGIGRATAHAAARAGARLFLTDRHAEALARVVAEIEGGGGCVQDQRAFDITDVDAVRSFAASIHAAHGAMDVVMNVAGIAVWGSVERLRHEDWRRAVDVNLMGPIHVIECFVPEMIRAGRGGHLVNVSSAAGLFGLPWHAAYSAGKFGLRGVSEVLRFDLARHRIGVSLVCPGAVDTGLVHTLEVRGVDTRRPELERLRRRFRAHAITPERAAAAILRGVERNQYLVFTSPDIRVGHWFQRKFALPYELAMRLLNVGFQRAVRAAAAQAEPRAAKERAA